MKTLILLSISLFVACLFSSCGSVVSHTPVVKKPYEDFQSEQKSFVSEEGTIRYIDKGPRDGEPILLLHGVPTSGWLYRHMIDDLVKRGYRVIAPDMLGFGSSDSPKGYEIYSEKHHAKRIVAMMNSLGLKSWNHVCHDAGGLWTQALALHSPESIKSLTLLNCVLLDEGFDPPVRMNKGPGAKLVMYGYRNKLTNRILIKALFKHGMEDWEKLSISDKEGYRRPLMEGKTKGIYYFFTKTCNYLPDYRDGLNNLAKRNCPVQVIWGTNDEILHWEPQANDVSELLEIDSSDIHLLDANHFLQEEEPEQLSKFIDEFVGSR